MYKSPTICHSCLTQGQMISSLWHVNTHPEGLVMYVKSSQYFYNNNNVSIIRIRFMDKQDDSPNNPLSCPGQQPEYTTAIG